MKFQMVSNRDLADPGCPYCDGDGEHPSRNAEDHRVIRCACIAHEITVEALRDLVLRDQTDTLRASGHRCMSRVVDGLRRGALAPDAWADLIADADRLSRTRGPVGDVSDVLARIQRGDVVDAAKVLAKACGLSVSRWVVETSEDLARRAT